MALTAVTLSVLLLPGCAFIPLLPGIPSQPVATDAPSEPDGPSGVVTEEDEDFGTVEVYDVLTDGSLSPEATGAAAEVWELFQQIATVDFTAEVMLQFRVGDAPDSDTLAYVYQDDDPQYWVLAANLATAEDRDLLVSTLIHEYAHILTLSTDEFDPAGTCDPAIELAEGCPAADSVIGQFRESFWDGYGSDAPDGDNTDPDIAWDFYLAHEDDFVSDYAATNVSEDLAETFAVYVIEDVPDGDSVVAQKLQFLDSFPELAAIRERIRANLGSEQSPAFGYWIPALPGLFCRQNPVIARDGGGGTRDFGLGSGGAGCAPSRARRAQRRPHCRSGEPGGRGERRASRDATHPDRVPGGRSRHPNRAWSGRRAPARTLTRAGRRPSVPRLLRRGDGPGLHSRSVPRAPGCPRGGCGVQPYDGFGDRVGPRAICGTPPPCLGPVPRDSPATTGVIGHALRRVDAELVGGVWVSRARGGLGAKRVPADCDRTRRSRRPPHPPRMGDSRRAAARSRRQRPPSRRRAAARGGATRATRRQVAAGVTSSNGAG